MDWDDSLNEVNKSAVALIDHFLDEGYSVIFDGNLKNPNHAIDAINLAKSKIY